jgi:hypothetical protein
MHKIPKTSAGYQFRPETEYRCQECVFAKTAKEQSACAFFGPSETISPASGSCNYFTHGEGKRFDLPWLALLTKDEAGYAENLTGFSCKRCEYLDPLHEDCRRVDRNSPGDTPGKIDPMACCNLWSPDSKRAALQTPALLKLLADRGDVSPAEYRKMRQSRD